MDPVTATKQNAGRYLLLMDINGTLCHRTDEKIPSVMASRCLQNHYMYERPGISAFMTTLKETNAYSIHMYSTIPRSSEVIRAVLPTHPDLHDDIVNHESHSEKSRKRPFHATCDFLSVWCDMMQQGYGLHNTILLDSDKEKICSFPGNGILIPGFNRHDVIEQTQHSLDAVLAYLIAVAKERPSDVRTYLLGRPFRMDMSMKTCGARAFAEDLSRAVEDLTLEKALFGDSDRGAENDDEDSDYENSEYDEDDSDSSEDEMESDDDSSTYESSGDDDDSKGTDADSDNKGTGTDEESMVKEAVSLREDRQHSPEAWIQWVSHFDAYCGRDPEKRDVDMCRSLHVSKRKDSPFPKTSCSARPRTSPGNESVNAGSLNGDTGSLSDAVGKLKMLD